MAKGQKRSNREKKKPKKDKSKIVAPASAPALSLIGSQSLGRTGKKARS